MNTLCESVEKDWSGASRIEHLKESVHSALGQLIKQRKVYYTGKGYFLVTPDSPIKGIGTRLNKFRHSLRDRSSGVFNNGNVGNGAPNAASGGEEVPDTSRPSVSPTTGLDLSMNHSLNNNYDGSSLESSVESSASSPNVSGGPFNLERSQSLRISKKSLRNMSKGGSLR